MTPEELTEALPWDERPVWRQAAIGPGWVDLVYGLHEALKSASPNYTVVQVKEKFGGLRYYINTGTEDSDLATRMYEAIGIAESRSLKICELCGTEKDTETKALSGKWGWIRTLCNSCREKQIAEREARLAIDRKSLGL